eukprot:364236_1
MVTLATALVFVFISHIVSAYDANSCAYYGLHEVATPLGACNSFSHDAETYSYKFVCDEYQDVALQSFSDTECTQSDFVQDVGDDEEGSTLQCIGSGENCHTIDVAITGFTDTTTDTCADASDVATFHYVVDECIPSTVEGIQYSTLISCDAEKIWLEKYTNCQTCDCEGEEYTTLFYTDLPGCFDITCGSHVFTGTGTPATTTSAPKKKKKKKKCSRMSKENIHQLKALMINGVDLTQASHVISKQEMFKESVINGSVTSMYHTVMMNWTYIVAVICAVVLLGGAWRLIKQKEYSII